jgi:SpoVK/Ycf46/Vps4 family AAA+-type ATPase
VELISIKEPCKPQVISYATIARRKEALSGISLKRDDICRALVAQLHGYHDLAQKASSWLSQALLDMPSYSRHAFISGSPGSGKTFFAKAIAGGYVFIIFAVLQAPFLNFITRK